MVVCATGSVLSCRVLRRSEGSSVFSHFFLLSPTILRVCCCFCRKKKRWKTKPVSNLNPHSMLLTKINNKIRSLVCFCGNNSGGSWGDEDSSCSCWRLSTSCWLLGSVGMDNTVVSHSQRCRTYYHSISPCSNQCTKIWDHTLTRQFLLMMDDGS
jgi:hypothetical protein